MKDYLKKAKLAKRTEGTGGGADLLKEGNRNPANAKVSKLYDERAFHKRDRGLIARPAGGKDAPFGRSLVIWGCHAKLEEPSASGRPQCRAE